MVTANDELVARLSRKKSRTKNQGRKVGRNFKYYGISHSQTLYRSRNQREKNKARRAAQRERRLQIRRDKKNGV